MTPETQNFAHEKKRLRQECRTRRAAIPDADRAELAKAFARHFLKAVKVENRNVAGYSAFRHELDTLPLLAMLAAGDRICGLPITSPPSRLLYFRRWHSATKMVDGAFGIPVPSPEAETFTPDIIIVPLVGFDAARHRLGYGAGYYDATLADLRQRGHKFLTVGAAFSTQQLAAIPTEPHDQQLDLVITEKGVLGKDF